MNNDIRISFNEEARNDAKIKVIGVGGGGTLRLIISALSSY